MAGVIPKGAKVRLLRRTVKTSSWWRSSATSWAIRTGYPL
jgi:hypothetical protein